MAKNVPAKSNVDEFGLDVTSNPEYGSDVAGQGADFDANDIRMPRLKLGQSMTPEVKERMAEEGDFIHTTTGDIYLKAGEIMPIIPVMHSKEYIIWRDRKNRKEGENQILNRARRVRVNGLVRYKWDEPEKLISDKVGGVTPVEYYCQTYIDEDGLADWGTQIPGNKDSGPAASETHNYVLVLPSFGWEMVGISLSRTQIGPAKDFNSMIKRNEALHRGTPIYGAVYNLGSVTDRRGENMFANYKFSDAKKIITPGSESFERLKAIYEQLAEANVVMDLEDDAAHTESSDSW